MNESPLSITTTARRPRQTLLTLVREACDMLVAADPSVVGSVTVSRTLDDERAARLVESMARRLAEEYGVAADARADGSKVTIRLSRNSSHIHVERNGGRHDGSTGP
jgi:hypothetical protein